MPAPGSRPAPRGGSSAGSTPTGRAATGRRGGTSGWASRWSRRSSRATGARSPPPRGRRAGRASPCGCPSRRVMGRGRWVVALIGLLALGGGAAAARLEPGRYVEADGAMPLQGGGSVVDPYFATKALVVADVAGLDVRETARRWIEWALARQRFDGRFERY